MQGVRTGCEAVTTVAKYRIYTGSAPTTHIEKNCEPPP